MEASEEDFARMTDYMLHFLSLPSGGVESVLGTDLVTRDLTAYLVDGDETHFQR